MIDWQPAVTVAALYVDPRGVYSTMPGVELWDEARDARTYDGPHPVVAHPPCARWCLLAAFVESRGGRRRGEDDGCFEAALAAVRCWGGVLEHPAYSLAFERFGLPRPRPGYWQRELFAPGWVTEVDQAHYGHLARKRTWLYAAVPAPVALDWRPGEWSHRMSGFDKPSTVPELPKRLRAATPPAFAAVLVSMARSCRPVVRRDVA